jgi:hypothetical protein
MSLHRYLVPPPLALAISPAKPHPPARTEKKSDEKEKKEDKAKDPDAKADDKKAQDNPNPKAHDEVKDDPVAKAGGDQVKTPGSMIPEPPTPADDLVDPGAKASPDTPRLDAPKGDKDVKADTLSPDDNNAAEVDDSDKAKVTAADDKANIKTDASDEATMIGPKTEDEAKASAEVELEPLRLIGPPPKYPIRTRLDLDPSKPWPPVEPDPRGAYHLYAKGCYKGIIESVYIDVTKDGWMSEHWREKSERDALEKLRGEDVKRAKRELEIEARRREVRKVPKNAGALLLMLWNLLVEAPNNEVSSRAVERSGNSETAMALAIDCSTVSRMCS